MSPIPVHAEVSGTVARLTAPLGALLQPDDELLVLESMKMEISCQAPAGGRLARLLVGEGELVEEGQLLAEIEHQRP
ncbi:MAG: acetyl-CoA carboxylase biotin carboxyl carrier protein subunit [Burkholderiaceae bacterium]|nr:acetyl-CoA carboxylase biotin carboxyl carrier protein subunit [Burkholderiaceae bacterium]